MVGQPLVAIGGGAHGVNVHLAPADLIDATSADVVDVTIPDEMNAPGLAATS
jgi:prolyl-tRNA editing enzyme YbaK/EbsC (Cys-tRNA(Pro) deacylase)